VSPPTVRRSYWGRTTAVWGLWAGIGIGKGETKTCDRADQECACGWASWLGQRWPLSCGARREHHSQQRLPALREPRPAERLVCQRRPAQPRGLAGVLGPGCRHGRARAEEHAPEQPEARSLSLETAYLWPITKGRNYTWSVYLKTDAPGGAVKVYLVGLGSEKEPTTWTSLKPTAEWVRYSGTGVHHRCLPGERCLAPDLEGKGTLWVCAPQMEEGTTATAYTPAPVDQPPAAAVRPPPPRRLPPAMRRCRRPPARC